ncbi:MAG: EamA family transporter [Deltaproteobacteria bacterium]|nr:EamA family transporter [Deltaproteobacteria bacterium]
MNILIMSTAMFLAGSSIVVAKKLICTMPVFLANELSLLLALLILLPVGVRHLTQVAPRDAVALFKMLRWPFLQALFGMALFRVLMFLGLQHLSAIDGGLVTATTPGVMALLAFVLLREKTNIMRIVGILLAVSGVAVLHWHNTASGGSAVGVVLILLATACEAMLTIFRKMEKAPISPLSNTFYIVVFSSVLLAPATVVEGQWPSIISLSLEEWMGCLYMGWIATVLAYWCWGYASAHLEAGVTGIITAMMPLSATVISIVWLGEPPGLQHLLGGLCVISSIFVITAPFDAWMDRRQRT